MVRARFLYSQRGEVSRTELTPCVRRFDDGRRATRASSCQGRSRCGAELQRGRGAALRAGGERWLARDGCELPLKVPARRRNAGDDRTSTRPVECSLGASTNTQLSRARGLFGPRHRHTQRADPALTPSTPPPPSLPPFSSYRSLSLGTLVRLPTSTTVSLSPSTSTTNSKEYTPFDLVGVSPSLLPSSPSRPTPVALRLTRHSFHHHAPRRHPPLGCRPPLRRRRSRRRRLALGLPQLRLRGRFVGRARRPRRHRQGHPLERRRRGSLRLRLGTSWTRRPSPRSVGERRVVAFVC